MRANVIFAIAFAAAACRGAAPETVPAPDMNQIAERYVKLVLAVGQHDADYVDAYYGDPSWKPSGTPASLIDLAATAGELRRQIGAVVLAANADGLVRLRKDYLDRQVSSVMSRIAMLSGTKYSFDEESKRLYDAEPPHHTEQQLQATLDEIARLLPGSGALVDRYTAFRQAYVIPPDRLDRVFRAAVDGCRSRTLEHLALPAGEAFTIEYVKGKSWSAYNWYKGNFTSVIQVNTDLPITIDRAIDLACHEGYPGHHVYNALLEKTLVRDRGWVEFSVYPLFSPQSLIAEGTANFGIDVAFPGDARTAFERDTLYPLAGLDAKTAPRYAAVQALIDKLSYAGNEAARRYLNGETDRATAAAWLQRFAMMPKDRAEQRTRFFDQYRSYVINYNLGKDLVRAYVERRGGTADRPAVRWREFGALLASPRLPSGLY
ncbi:MAG TPA: hypothetical protein VFO19_21850 [Vicinamibacterales bacterium]|nr:hypothetical protein [Vicinamibacterales bacterium]